MPLAEGGDYSKNGGGLFLSASTRIGPRAVSLWGDVGAEFFQIDKEETHITLPNGPTLSVDEQTEESMLYGHIGLQIGSTSRSAFFRPRAGIGVGLYYFYTETIWHQGDVLDEIASETWDKQWTPGWRGFVGADFFIVPSTWAIALDFKYDRVTHLDHHVPLSRPNNDGRFYSVTIGFVGTWDTERDKKVEEEGQPVEDDGLILAESLFPPFLGAASDTASLALAAP